MDNPESNPELQRTILEVVENQIQAHDPPETRQTFERLQAAGCAADEARRLIAIAVMVELFHIMRDREVFNRERFIWNLAQLPREPWDQDGNELYAPHGSH